MKIVGILQTVFALGALIFAGWEVYVAAHVSAWIYAFVGVLLLGVHYAYFHQALLLQSASEHFLDGTDSEGTIEEGWAQDHIVLAFKRLRPVFMVDTIAVAILATHAVLRAIA